MEFFKPLIRQITKDKKEIYPEFYIKSSSDLMTRGRDFYAMWDEDNKRWTTSIDRVIDVVDKELYSMYDSAIKAHPDWEGTLSMKLLSKSSSGGMRDFNNYVQHFLRDNYHQLDSKIIFSNQETTKEDYSTKTLPYPLEEGSYAAWDKLVSTLYSPAERQKIEWAIGAVVTGDSRWIQKFVVFVGDAGTGKSTIMNIIRMLFDGYVSTFDAKALGSSNSAFALEAFKSNPLVAIQDDADLSRIEDNTRLNSLISHEPLLINEKHKSLYEMKINSFIFLGSNKEVMITDARSGLLRRLIDITPTGEKLNYKDYMELMDQIKFELGAIAYHCKEVYESDPHIYDKYFPVRMIDATNHMFNFISDNRMLFEEEDQISLVDAWQMYKRYCQDALVPYPYSKQRFKVELSAYFDDIVNDTHDKDRNHVRNLFKGFKSYKLDGNIKEVKLTGNDWLSFKVQSSLLDLYLEDEPAQYATESGIPTTKWDSVRATLKDISTDKLHYVKVPSNLIVIDFDLKDENGNKSYERNLEAANKWPHTYAELSKSEAGIHLHYIYNGDVDMLSSFYEEGIEVKVFRGNSALRRKLTMCNDIPIATITSGLPQKKGDNGVIEFSIYKNETAIRTLIEKNLAKEYHPGTKPSIDFIYDILEKAYKDGISYDVTDLRPRVLAFANNSSNHAEYCVKKVAQMKFMQDRDVMEDNSFKSGANKLYSDTAPLVFYDVEVFPNLFVVVFKYDGKDNITKMINPEPESIEKLCNFKLVGFNCRRYDNHILYARMRGYTNEQLFNLSQKIINNSKNATFSEAYNLSYTDVYDFASAAHKMSLKKWEIELGIHHLELGLPWDQPVPENLWEKVADYCVNDVVSTEEVFHHLSGDWTARQILADISGLSANDSTNSHTTRIIFGSNRHPQDQFNYRDLSKPVTRLDPEQLAFLEEQFPYMMKWWRENTDSLLPYFDGYSYKNGVSSYKNVEVVGEGGRVYAEEGMYGNVALDDVESMHPHSILAECLFGLEYTERYFGLLRARLHVKHGDYDKLHDILDGALSPYVDKLKNGEISPDDLSTALKTAINAVYGLTSAKFDHPFHDIRNKDNIVAKRGALFMIDLEEYVKSLGYTVAHIKTDSIKIPDADIDILEKVKEFGARYGYNFDHEATYDRMTLVNHAVYIAKYASSEDCMRMYNYIPKDNKKHPCEWTATGAQFADPFVYKTLFTKEKLEFSDYCQTKSVMNNLYLDFNENLPEGEHDYRFVGRVGSFIPVKSGAGGGILLRGDSVDSKLDAVVGTKSKLTKIPYRWMESEVAKINGKEDDIDISYFIELSDAAVSSIEALGDYNWFVSDQPYIKSPTDDFMNLPSPVEEEIPFN